MNTTTPTGFDSYQQNDGTFLLDIYNTHPDVTGDNIAARLTLTPERARELIEELTLALEYAEETA